MKKRLIAAILLLAPLSAAGETDPSKLLNDLKAANDNKESGRVAFLLPDIITWAESAKDQGMADAISDELTKSLKVVKGNWGTIRGICDALGALRSKKGLSKLKRMAFLKESAEGDELSVQIAAITAVGKYRDPRMLDELEDQCKSKNVEVAKTAYAAFKFYGPCDGRVRKKCAEIVMKRMESEYPSSAPGGGGGVSAEQQERWNQLQSAVVASMQAICHETTINDIENWRLWWRENKKNPKAWKDPKKPKE